MSQQHPPTLSLSPDRREAKLALIESFDGMAPLRNVLRAIAEDRKEWAGIPMPLEGARLVIEELYPMAKQIMAIGDQLKERPKDDPPQEIRNIFWSWQWRCEVAVWEEEGKIVWGRLSPPNSLNLQLNTLWACDAWGIEQESNAVQTLAGLVKHRQFKQYMLTGMFMERSKRSNISYLFRRLRPTIAITNNCENMRILCAMCMHPIGYYEGSWAGAMTPTDDVLAHLMLMRGDEHMFWRRCNQHAPHRHNAGIF